MVDLVHTINRLINSKKRINDFIDRNIVDWSEQVILEPTRRLAAEVGLSQSAQNAITIQKTGFMNVQLMWEYFSSDNAPLHQYLENGTDPHDIEAKGKDNGGSDFLHWKDILGNSVFIPRGKIVKHPGTDGYQILAKGWEQNRDQLRQRIVEETNNFLEVTKL